ncbi:hypothetical protein H8S95_10890 [Pontibacter sp. KCTC 32443]|uniref:hypothetical protein n=1 Tax=Pontibacter TaxID=323449 RepID=UPI00164CEA4C|nr:MULTISPECIES: hypothetical protein [Pontibacter]MBC5774567.1 hypothetical protein [Pontibacter sp. KCTC 32443]
MKLSKLLAATVLSVSLYSCGCEDVNLGNMEFTDELTPFLPVELTNGKSYYATIDNAKLQMNYQTSDGFNDVTLPAGRINYSGKFDLNSCNEYYTAKEKVYMVQVGPNKELSFIQVFRKDASKDRINDIDDKNDVGDIIEFFTEYKNIFPEPIPDRGTMIGSYTTSRTFYFKDANATTIERGNYMQEFLPTVTLNGVEHKNVYHVYIKEPHFESYEPSDNGKYPLDYVQGLYIKEGIGVINFYTYRGKQIDITIE